MAERYFDDFEIGETFTTRGVSLTESMIIDFALAYDPQPFHIDVEAAKQSNYGGLIASGFHTLALGFRMVLETGIFRASSMGSPGFDELALAAAGAPRRHAAYRVRSGGQEAVELEARPRHPARRLPHQEPEGRRRADLPVDASARAEGLTGGFVGTSGGART